MSLEKLKLTLNPSGDNYQYLIYPIDSVDYRQSKDATSISLPGQSYKNNILMGISGQEAQIDISFYIHNNGEDKANSASSGYTSTVTTVDEQITYLRDTMQASSFSNKWHLDDVNGTQFTDLDCFFEQFRVPVKNQESPKWKNATISLIVGESI